MSSPHGPRERAKNLGPRSLQWAALLVLLACSTGAATWRIRVATAPLPPPPNSGIAAEPVRPALLLDAPIAESPPGPSPAAPIPAPGAGLAAVRARLSTTAQTPAHEVDQWTLRLATAQRQDTEAALLRLTPYESLIRRILAREQVPQDLIYLALIESHYKPSATSSVGAAGIWQFMPRTARSYGLEVSTYVDERRDPVRSTQAAARHLRDLHRQFGSWHLAAAAYNAGGGRISRALSSHGGPRGGDELLYWQVRSYLPRETREYVPKLLAAVRIGREPLSYGIAPPEPATPLNFRLVWAEGGTSLDRIARASGASTDEVRALNPHLIRSMTPPGRRWPVRVPPISTSSPATDAGYSLKGSTHSVHPPVSLRSSTRDAPQARAPHDRVTS